MKLRLNIPLVALILFFNSSCSAGEVFFFDVNGDKSSNNRDFDIASRYYGINVVRCYDKNKCLEQIAGYRNRNTIDAIVLTADSLSSISHSGFINTVKRIGRKIPILIIGISPGNKVAVGLWSNGSITDIKSISGFQKPSHFYFSKTNVITKQLAGLSLLNNTKVINYFDIGDNDNCESIISLYSKEDKYSFPIFVKGNRFGCDFFFATRTTQDSPTGNSSYSPGKDRFYEIAPVMMFLRYACKDRCWHSKKSYANLTIDDPWLREPYGHLSYINLLNEMNREQFHTTIAFIPWNYDRSDNDVVSLIRNNPKNYSIAIHGNDHNFEEFYQLANPTGNSSAKQLNKYDMKIKTALARMEKFRELTKIPYDPVMIFPHRIAPLYAISLLKKNGYLATINSRNVPSGSEKPSDPTHHLRCITTEFDGFAVYRRQEVEFSKKEDIAIDLFLDNPILLYTHHDYFAGNIGNFNPIAKVVNGLQPDVVWGSLGYIVRNYHLEKLRNDGAYDILMYTNDLTLANNSNAALKYYIKKKGSPSDKKLKHIYVDGRPISFEQSDGYIAFEVNIPRTQSRAIAIEYAMENASTSMDLSKDNYYYAALRYLADFRDIVLSRNEYARKLIKIHGYSESGRTTMVLVVAFVGVLVIGFLLYRRTQYYHKKSSDNRN